MKIKTQIIPKIKPLNPYIRSLWDKKYKIIINKKKKIPRKQKYRNKIDILAESAAAGFFCA